MLEAMGEWKTAMERDVGEYADRALIVSIEEAAEMACSWRRRAKGIDGVKGERGMGEQGEARGV